MFNTLLLAEDVPSYWDNWNIDADLELKFRPVTGLISREVVANGCVELRICSVYRLTEKSTVTQDMVFSVNSPEIRFETLMDWQDNHRFLKTAFDTALHTNEARHEIQFGYVKRPTTRNSDAEKAKFEVCAHKYSDLSETRYGLALLNDCKYSVSAHDTSLWPVPAQGCNRPDYKGDTGQHFCTYAIIPHNGGFPAESVVKPAYLLNYPHFVTKGSRETSPLLHIDCDHVVTETVKPAEQIFAKEPPQAAERAFILRLYECERATVSTSVTVPGARELTHCDLLEAPNAPTAEGARITLSFRSFEIKTLRVCY